MLQKEQTILNRYERMLARRYLLPGKGEGIIFLVASISLLAVALGVAALIIVLSVMNGFRAELFEDIVGLNGHAVIEGYHGRLAGWQDIATEAKATPGVTSALPLIQEPLIGTANNVVKDILLRGMRIEDLRSNRTITSHVLAGDIHSIAPASNRVALGSRLADALGSYPGSQITIWNPQVLTSTGDSVPAQVTYTVGAIIETGVYDYDKALVIMPIEDAQQLLLMGNEVGIIQIRTSDADNVQTILAPLRSLLRGKGVVRDWRQMNSALFQALQVERVSMFVVLSLIVLVAAFNILSSLIMLVRAKTRDIAILRTMGASRRGMMKIFMTVGMVTGTLGIFLGALLATIFLFFRQDVVSFVQAITGSDISDPQVRFLTDLPSKTNVYEVVAVVVTALIFSFLATLYPAYRAASTDPVQVLRYD